MVDDLVWVVCITQMAARMMGTGKITTNLELVPIHTLTAIRTRANGKTIKNMAKGSIHTMNLVQCLKVNGNVNAVFNKVIDT